METDFQHPADHDDYIRVMENFDKSQNNSNIQ